jgi:hypothetical protein
LTNDEMICAGKAFNYYMIMDEYLKCMPFTQKERSEVKLALTIKIEYAFEKKDFKKLDKRMKELIKEIDRRKIIQKKKKMILKINSLRVY